MRLGNQNQITLTLIRHGKTEANEKRLYCGFSDPPLSPNGRAELQGLKAYPTADHYLHTGLLRTKESLNLLFGSPNSAEVANLKEMNFGIFELHSYEELKTTPAYQNWIETIDSAGPPMGETKAEFTKRIQLGLEEAAMGLAPGESAVVLTHGGVIATLMNLLFPGEKDFYQWQPACGKGYSLLFSQGNIINYTVL